MATRVGGSPYSRVDGSTYSRPLGSVDLPTLRRWVSTLMSRITENFTHVLRRTIMQRCNPSFLMLTRCLIKPIKLVVLSNLSCQSTITCMHWRDILMLVKTNNSHPNEKKCRCFCEGIVTNPAKVNVKSWPGGPRGEPDRRVNFQLLQNATEVAQWATRSCSRLQPATNNGVRVVVPIYWRLPVTHFRAVLLEPYLYSASASL